jgi:hypothetical protein
MRVILVLALILAVVPAGVRAESEDTAVASLTPEGSVSIRDGSVIPDFPKTGRWGQVREKSSAESVPDVCSDQTDGRCARDSRGLPRRT